MTLREVAERLGGLALESAGSADVADIVSDSRAVTPGTLFVCYPGHTVDGHRFIPQAVAGGASAALVCSSEGVALARSAGLPFVRVAPESLSLAAALAAKAVLSDPGSALRIVGVTGTNGKTTTAWLLRQAFANLVRRGAYLGTLGIWAPGIERELANTTPFSVELMRLVAEVRDSGAQDLAMEVSSHALAEHRVDGLRFEVGVFTNLTQDHLDFHGTMDAYREAKARLFDLSEGAVFNVDDPVGAEWAARTPGAVETSRRHGTPGAGSSRLVGTPVHVGVEAIELGLDLDGATAEFRASVGGSFNVDNLLSAAGALVALGYDLRETADALHGVQPAPGRFESVPNDHGIGVLVDYAHTPDALAKLLDAVRELTTGRVIAVFGCGGDRDRTKRPIMGRAAAERADIAVATSDNPRTEDPEAILNDTVPGLATAKQSLTIVDRAEAVAKAIQLAEPGDVVVVAGKGHENYQIIGRTKHPMDDRDLVRRGLEARR